MRFRLSSSRSVRGEWVARSEMLAAVDRCETAIIHNATGRLTDVSANRPRGSTSDFANFDPLPVAEVCSPQLYEEREPKRR